MNENLFQDAVVFSLGPVPVTQTMLGSAIVAAALIVLGTLAARAIVSEPLGRTAAAGRLLFRFLSNLAEQAAGRQSRALEVFSGTLFLFISTSSVLGQLPWVKPPTANLAATSALAVLVFLAVPVAGIRSRGPIGYLRHYLSPNPLLFPLHVISELSRTLALALRLFGNMMSGHLIVAMLVALVGVVLPVPLMALDLLIGFLQAYIFTILACVYIGAAIRVGDESHD